MRPSPVYPDLHVRTCDPCVFLQRAFTWHLSGYVFHSSISFKKKEKKRKELKMWFVFLFKVIHVHVYGFMRFSGWTCKSNRYFSNLFTLVQQKLSKAYAINCSCFATGAQKTLYNQKKKERTKRNNPWPHSLVIPNLPVQFCPFPVYPGWQSHKYDPLVLVQFACSWQEWFPLHLSMSMKSQTKKWDFRIMQKLPCISDCCVKECKPWLFSSFRWIARTRDCHTWWKKVVYAKTYFLITFSRATVSPILNN